MAEEGGEVDSSVVVDDEAGIDGDAPAAMVDVHRGAVAAEAGLASYSATS
jgi:hypothetical protein